MDMRLKSKKHQPSKKKRPLKFEIASRTEIDKYEFLAPEFFEKILDMNRNDCLITNETSLWDFHGERSNAIFYAKILEVYGVDVSNIEKGNLAKIFQKIAEAKRQ